MDGIFTVTTNDLTVSAQAPGGAGPGTNFVVGAQFGVKLVNLRQVQVKPTVAAAHGTLTFFGTVVDRAGLAELLRSKLGATLLAFVSQPAATPTLKIATGSVSVGTSETTVATLTAASGKRIVSPPVGSLNSPGGGVMTTAKLYYTDESDVERLLWAINFLSAAYFSNVGGLGTDAQNGQPTKADLDTLATHTVKAWRLTCATSTGSYTANGFLAGVQS